MNGWPRSAHHCQSTHRSTYPPGGQVVAQPGRIKVLGWFDVSEREGDAIGPAHAKVTVTPAWISRTLAINVDLNHVEALQFKMSAAELHWLT